MSNIFQEYKQYNLIIIYDSWFGIFSKEDYEKIGLIKIAELWIENNVICGGNPVSFYTSEERMVEKMKDNMLKFKKNIPTDVTIVIF